MSLGDGLFGVTVARNKSQQRFRFGRRQVRRNAAALALALVVSVLAALVQASQADQLYEGGGIASPLYAFESDLQDWVLRTRSPSSYGTSVGKDPRDLITIVAMDEKSIEELGLYRTWPRSYYARVVNALWTAPPRVIAFDIGFFEPSADDPELAGAFEAARSLRPTTALVLGGVGGGRASRTAGGMPGFNEGLRPLPTLAAYARTGFANVLPDARGVVRSMPLVARVGETVQPSLGLAAVAGYLRLPEVVIQRPDPLTLTFGTADLVARRIPVDETSRVRINYFGPPTLPDNAVHTFRVVSFVDVMRGRVSSAPWRDGIVFVGLLGATGFADDWWTPVSEQGLKMAGVEVHANVAATLLSSQYLRAAPLVAQLGLGIALAVAVALLAVNLGVMTASGAVVGLLAAFVFANLLTFDQVGLQLPLAAPLAAGALTYAVITAYRVGIEQRHGRSLVRALASVTPPSVADEIARDPDRVRMGGERRVLTVLFTDLKGFTSFSESVAPELLSRIITEYLQAMTTAVFRHQGTVDKFIGDAVMAFWNAPLDDPDHARHACEAALDMQASLAELSDRWEAEGLPRQRMRIGIHTGPASVGNMGTSRRFAYTALGDTVNLAARLEPLNNEYGTWICISQETLDAAGGTQRFLVRFLDLVSVKGKQKPAAVFELLGHTSDAPLAEHYAAVLDAYHRAMILYQAGSFVEAGELFRLGMQSNGAAGDAPSAVFVERCVELAAAEPVVNWDGVFVMHHK
jgi:adenylate cyclase